MAAPVYVQVIVWLAGFGAVCCLSAFGFWMLQACQRRIARFGVDRIKREQVSEHWLRTEGWK